MQLIEGEKDVINLDKVEEGMVAAVSSLKTSFTSAVVTRLNPSEFMWACLYAPEVLMIIT